jgi:hypothetical protein
MNKQSPYLINKKLYRNLQYGGTNKFNKGDINLIYNTKRIQILDVFIENTLGTNNYFYKIQEIAPPNTIYDKIAEADLVIDEREARVLKRALNPKENIFEYFKTNNYDQVIKKHIDDVKQMIENPYNTYIKLKERLEKDGADADFPEFEGVVGYLTKALFQTPEIIDFFSKKEYIVLLEQIINKLMSIQIDQRFNYPYRATIYCIESMLELLDLYYRTAQTKYSYNPSKQINENIGPYYHAFRYRSYMTTFTDSEFGIPKNIIFPTCANIGATDLIKIRCVPILIMGITNEPVYVDQYLNSPLDFWAHDIQHSKRQIQETLRYYDNFIKHNQYFQRRTLFDMRTELEFYKYMETYTKDIIIPIIKKNKSDSPETAAYKDIMKLVIFEIIHEKAWPITEKSLCRNIPLRYDEFPVENIKLNNDTHKIEAFHYLFADPTTIGNVIGKIRAGFYDFADNPNEKIIPKEYRTSYHVAKASRKLLQLINCSKIPSDEYMIALTTDRHAMQEMIDVKQIDIPDNPMSEIPYPLSDPNLYDDSSLYSIFKPKIGITDKDDQDRLHKMNEVIGYDPTFEQLGHK